VTVYVGSKADLVEAWTEEELRRYIGDAPFVRVSAVAGRGLAELQQVLADQLVGDAAGAELWISNERHAQALLTVRASLTAAAGASQDVTSLELLDALNALAAVTGRESVAEETLTSIFANFCVGK
jgi:tRNA modification GTPase